MSNNELVSVDNGKVTTSSMKVAEVFNKQHKDVLRSIETLDCSTEFNRRNFTPIDYRDSRNRLQKMYSITKDGFVFLAMGYTGKRAAAFKEAYIEAFNRMEKELKQPLAKLKNGFAFYSHAGILKKYASRMVSKNRNSYCYYEPPVVVAMGYACSYAVYYFTVMRTIHGGLFYVQSHGQAK